MSYVCSSCGDEWPDGQKECQLCGVGARTVYYTEAGRVVSWMIMSCSVCYALVSEGDTWRHAEWHEEGTKA